jgi:mono/diheme cytochrome c family protein
MVDMVRVDPPDRSEKADLFLKGYFMPQTERIQGKLMRPLLLAAMILVSVSGCSQDQHDHPTLTTGEQLFNYHCAECHGEQGTGNLFDGIPANILTQKNQQAIITYIPTDTGQERTMPVFSAMPAEEAKIITEHLFTLQKTYDTKGSQIKQLLIEP